MSTTTDPQIRSSRSFPVRLSPGEIVLSIGLIVAGLGVLTLFLGGLPGFPTVPPGPLIMVGMALVVLFIRWRWISAVGLVVAVGISVGFIATLSGAIARLTDPSQPVLLGGTVAQLAGLVVDIIGGVAALVAAARTVRRERKLTS